jgi:SAM-dependent methyltransferase
MNYIPLPEQKYLRKAYATITLESPAMHSFLDEVYSILAREIAFGPDQSLVDIGCGRGYFVEYLRLRGHSNVCGIDPCGLLLEDTLSDTVVRGSFEDNPYSESSFDIAFTCHTLHHLPDRNPIFAVKEMLRLARKYVVIVEINNTNLPIFLTTLAMFRVERNAAFYNRVKVASLVQRAGGQVVLQADLQSCYLSGNSLFYRFLAALGSRPYNIVIAKRG